MSQGPPEKRNKLEKDVKIIQKQTRYFNIIKLYVALQTMNEDGNMVVSKKGVT